MAITVSVIVVHAAVAVLEIPCHKVTKNSTIPFQAIFIPSITLFQTSTAPFQRFIAPSEMVVHKPEKNSTRPFHKPTTKSTKALQICLPVSVWVKNQTNAATTAVIATTKAPIGLAAITALKAKTAPLTAKSADLKPVIID